MKSSALHLEGYYVRELSVVLNERFADKTPFSTWSGYHYHPDKATKIEPSQFGVKSEIAQKISDPSKWRFELTVRSSGRKDIAPYTFSISLVGYFHVHKEDDDIDERVIFLGTSAVLFAAAREALASATARGPYPGVILPLVSFVDDAEEMAANTAKRVHPKLLTKKSAKKGGKKRSVQKATKKK